jgi:hypothetical membrane protein
MKKFKNTLFVISSFLIILGAILKILNGPYTHLILISGIFLGLVSVFIQKTDK